MKKVKILVPGGYIIGTLQGPINDEEKHPGVLVIHGLTSKEDKYINRFKKLAEKGYVCLTVSLRGHGKSSGKLKALSRRDHIEDVKRAYKYLKDLDSVNEKKIGIYGKSYGGYVTAILSSKLKPKTIILGAPALYKNNNLDEQFANIFKSDPVAWRKSNLDSNSNYALKSLKKYKGNVLIIVFGEDEEVPKGTTDTYIKLKIKIKSETIKNSNHGLDNPIWDKKTMEVISRWFEKNL